MQRFFDIIFSLIAISILSPLFLIVIVVLKFSGEGEIFYRQNRVGVGGKLFGVFKFVTMLKNSPNMGTGFLTTRDDPRVLPFGKLLRKTKLNEFPQLINILFGDMSFVGPRPQVPKHFDLYSDRVKNELNKVRPGLTGIGSIVFRDEEGILEKNKNMTYEECYSQVIAPYKGELEIWYIRRRSVPLYFTLMILTGWIVLFPESKLYMSLFKDIPQPPPSLVF